MSRLLALLGVVAATLFGAPAASADPEDLMPYCSGNETPANNNCRAGSDQSYDDNTAPGANPDVPVGVHPAI